MTKQEREEKAFEALIVDTLRRAETSDVDIQAIREPNDKERRALKLVGDDFVDQLISGTLSLSEACEKSEGADLALAAGGGELYRSDDIDEETAEELDRADKEIIERKKKEHDEKTS